MKKPLLILLAVLSVAAILPPATTVFTRAFLRASDAAAARTALGISTNGGGTPGGSAFQIQFNTNNSAFGGTPNFLYTPPYLTISNVSNPLLLFRGTNEGLGNLATYGWEVGPSGFIVLREFNPSLSTSNLVFSFGGGISGGFDMRAQAYGNFYVSTTLVATTVQTTNLNVNGPTVVAGNVTSGGTVTAPSAAITGTSQTAFTIGYPAADAFVLGFTRGATMDTNSNWITPTTNATGLSYLTVSPSGTNNQFGYTLASSVGGGTGNTVTNPIVYGTRRFPTGSDATNVNWATNSFTKQGITTNANFTISFINHPPAADSELVYTIYNTTSGNLTVTLLNGNAITNNVWLNSNTTNVTSFTVLPGITKVEWGYNGNQYYFKTDGPLSTTGSGPFVLQTNGVVSGLTLGGSTTNTVVGASKVYVNDANSVATGVSTTGSGNVMRTRTGVQRSIWVDAGAMVASTTNGPASGTYAPAGADNMTKDVYDFDDTTSESVQFYISMPDEWDLGTIKARFFWTSASGTGGVTWGIAGGAASDNDALGATLGTEVTVDDTLLATDKLHVTAATTAVTIGGTPALNDAVLFKVARKPAAANDTKAGDARLLGVKLFYSESLVEPSAQ